MNLNKMQKGFELWSIAQKEQNLPHYRSAIALIKSGLNEATEPVPYWWGMLALLNYEAGVLAYQQSATDANLLVKSAEIHARTALRDNSLDFRSQLVLTYLAGDAITEKVTFEDVVNGGGVLGTIFGTAIKGTRAHSSRSKFCNHIDILLQAFDKAMHEDPDCRTFLELSERLSGIADFCRDMGLQKQEKVIYRAIADVDFTTLTYDDLDTKEAKEFREMVDNVSTLAEVYLEGIY